MKFPLSPTRGARGGMVALAAGALLVGGLSTAVVAQMQASDPDPVTGCTTNTTLACSTSLLTPVATPSPDEDTPGPRSDRSFTGTLSSGTTGWFTWPAPQAGQTLLLPGQSTGQAATTLRVRALPAGMLPADATEADLISVDVTSTGESDSPATSSFTAQKDVVYVFSVAAAAKGGASSAFIYTIWQTTPGGPANDHVSAAVSVDQVVTRNAETANAALGEGTLAGATLEDGEETAHGTSSVWYSWTVPNKGAELAVTATGGVTLTGYAMAEKQPDVDPDATTAPFPRLDRVSAPGASTTLSGPAGSSVLLRVTGAQQTFALTATRTGFKERDLDAPVVACDQPKGWQRKATVTCTATDAGSGVAKAEGLTLSEKGDSAEFTLAVDTIEGTVTTDATSTQRSVCDVDGNCATAGPVGGISIDTVPPVVTCAPVSTTWQNTTSVSVDCTAVDGTNANPASGLASADDASFTLTTRALAAGEQSDSVPFAPRGKSTEDAPLGQICDVVGNCAAIVVPTGSTVEDGAPATAKLDLSGPEVSCEQPTSKGWVAANATVDCTATDTGSGIAEGSSNEFQLSTLVGEGSVNANASTNSVAVCDLTGNCATAGPFTGFKVDRSAPTVSCDVPATGSWLKGSSHDVSCTVVDAGSGLDGKPEQTVTVATSIPAGTESYDLTVKMPEMCDTVGNCAKEPNVSGFGLDDRAPSVVCGQTPQTWANSDVVVECVSDPGAGTALADPATAAFTLTASIADGTSSDKVAFPTHPDVCDTTGNCTPVQAPAPAKIDRVVPTVTCEMPTASARDAGFDAEVVVACTSTDADSGLASPATASFTLATSVGAGNTVDDAVLSTITVDDAAGNSFVAGNAADFGTFAVNRSTTPAAPQWVDVPSKVTVLDARRSGSTGGIAVPFEHPRADSAVSVTTGCAPDATGVFPTGETIVSCSARDGADQTIDTQFVLDVLAAPTLAAGSSAAPGGTVPVSGSGFSGPVAVEFDGVVVDSLDPTAGRVEADAAVPEDASAGEHTVVLRGRGADAQPRLVVMPMVVEGARAATPTPTPEPTVPPTPTPTPTPTKSPAPKPTTAPKPKPVTVVVRHLTVHDSITPRSDRRSPFTFTHKVRISGAGRCVGTARTTVALKTTKTVTQKIKGKKTKKKVTVWKTFKTQNAKIKSCKVDTKVSFTKKQMPKHKGRQTVRVRTTYTDVSGFRIVRQEKVKVG